MNISPVKVYLDDERPAPAGWILVRNRDQFLAAMRMHYYLEEVSFDHDLGELFTGYDCLVDMIQGRHFPSKVYLHTMNPVGRRHMRNYLLRNGYSVGASGMEFTRGEDR